MCPALSVEVNGAWSPATCYSGEHHTNLGSCDITCHIGLIGMGSTSLTCQENGHWDYVQGYCSGRTILDIYSCFNVLNLGIKNKVI